MREAFICDFARTPIGRYGGALSSVRTDDLAAIPIRALMERHAGLDPSAIDEVYFGCANQAGEDNRNVARMASLLAGLPETAPGITLNRLCGSGLDAVIGAARAVKTGEIEIAIAGGVESMSRAPFVVPKSQTAFDRSAAIYDTTIGWRFVNAAMHARYGTDSMAETAENVAVDYKVSRADQDVFAYRSQQKAGAAQAAGRFAREIVPVVLPSRRGEARCVDVDEHPRPQTTLEELERLKPIVADGINVTAGNASGINDGAAAMLIATEEGARRYGLTPIARIVSGASAGVLPRVMGIGPVPAIVKLLKSAALHIEDLSVLELNEAFASQSLAVLRAIGLGDDDPRVNPNGGAIALGHPLGMSGVRIAGSAAIDLAQCHGRYAMATMCVGVGQGVALLLEKA